MEQHLTSSIALFALRLLIAAALIHESWLKITQAKRQSTFYHIHPTMLKLLGICEILAAVSLFTGIAIDAALWALVLLFVSSIMVQWLKQRKYWAKEGGWEYDVMMLVCCFLLIVFGPGSFVVPL